MRLLFPILMVVVAFIAVIGVHGTAYSNENFENDPEGNRSCAEAYQTCDSIPCCNERSCVCNWLGKECKCKKSLGELIDTLLGS
uniref:Toxin 36 isoform a S1 n=1 Tax=Cupiennius salei TaxID=6928 RepID=A0A4Y5UGL8_CUPSA|nr:toxin 36 isoform a S1 precursor [Cupiennius salei]QDC23116.1 toxin 36 isoform a S2 precursor [Cupiennius salei]